MAGLIKSDTYLGYTLPNKQYGSFVFDGSPFIIVSDYPECFYPCKDQKPKQTDFRQIVELISLGANIILFENSFNKFSSICYELGICFPDISVLNGIDHVFYNELQLCLDRAKFEWIGLDFVAIPYFMLISHPVFHHYKELHEFVESSKN